MRVAIERKNNIASIQAKLDKERRERIPQDRIATWEALALDQGRDGTPHATLSNVTKILKGHKNWEGRLWFDDFRGKIFDHDEPWTDAEDLRLLCWLQGEFGLPRMGMQTVSHAVVHVAFENRRNSVCDWLGGLAWDGNRRLEHWLGDCLGAEQNDYTAALGRNWLISMVARAFRPGCQADHMPVLEGPMGRGKSSALAVLGGEWYQALGQAFGSKEFMEAIQGVWLAEIPDMAGFSRREHTAVIAAVTTRNDHYRASYGRHAEDHPRVTIFAATSENDDYLQDGRGIRRYWPVRCADIDLALLSASREQLFAEAVELFRAEQSWHEMPEEITVSEQKKRQAHDVWVESLEMGLGFTQRVTVAEACGILGIEAKDRSQSDSIRVAKSLKVLGFEQKTVSENGKSVRLYIRNCNKKP